MGNTKKKIAAITAVLYYLQAEEEASQLDLQESGATPSAQYSLWTFSSRQSEMMMRNMAQMRIIPSWKG